MKTNEETWKLDKIVIEFKNGYDFKEKPEDKVDHYEGSVRFSNGKSESFQFNVKPDMADKYIALIAEDIVLAATGWDKDLLNLLD